MAISEISNQGFITPSSKERKGKEPVRPLTPQGDRVDVSAEARSLYETEGRKRLDEIREKIRNGFYSQREVAEKVADAILRDLLK